MKQKIWLIALLAVAFTACKSPEETKVEEPETFSLEAVDTNYHTSGLVLTPSLKAKVLFNSGDLVKVSNPDTLIPSKTKNDFMTFIPAKPGVNDHGWLWTNHEVVSANEIMADGGGATLLELKKENGAWNVQGDPWHVDFRPVHGTYNNCLGGTTPWGNVLTSEEYEPWSNKEIYRDGTGIRDTSDLNGYPRYMQYGWMVEVDIKTKKAIRKLWDMGRFSHEGAYCMPDGKTVYLMDDEAPGVFFKFVAAEANDYGKGQLYAYKQSEDLKGGEWITLPMERDSMNQARNVALRRGATIFVRLEDIELLPDGRFMLTETGRDVADLGPAMKMGGNLAQHLDPYTDDAGIFKDFYGRLLIFDEETDNMSVYLAGGHAAHDKSIILSNPDNISVNADRNLLIIHEDMNGTSEGRVPEYATGWLTNEIFALDLAIANPSLDDLVRIAVVPKGSESTGPCWTPDFSGWFFNVQHPDPTNPPPYERDATLSITGF